MSSPSVRQQAQAHGEAVPALALKNVSFSYPVEGGYADPVLRDVSLSVPTGAFALLCGSTGSGKTTCLRLAKAEVTPAGLQEGSVEVFGRSVASLDVRTSCQLVGYVFQNPESQIVCDTVWHELAFGLENLGLTQVEMRRRLAEVCMFLGIEGWLRQRCNELSGGQRQIVSLAAALALRPRLLLLDEPTAMLDPASAHEFLALLFRANRELGVTVVVATHDPAPMAAYATCGFRIEDGSVCQVAPGDLGTRHPLGGTGPAVPASGAPMRLADDVWVRYGHREPWVLRGCDLRVSAGEVRAVVGGNGSGKSTLLNVVAGVLRPWRGRVSNPLSAHQALLPQQPKVLLGRETVAEELMGWSAACGYGTGEVEDSLARLGLGGARDRHPYDLSGGQQQLLALEKVLLTRPRLLLLDEPTKGLDESTRARVAERVRALAQDGCAIVVATHDMAFVQATAHAVTLLFDGQAGDPEPTDEFFARSWAWRP